MKKVKNRNKKTVIRIVGLYVLFGCVWILLSDWILTGLTNGPELLTRLQNYKGWAFVLATAGLLCLVLHRRWE
mgnify:CR=1 FL=1